MKPALWLAFSVLLGCGAGALVLALYGLRTDVENGVSIPQGMDIRPPEASFDPVFEPCAHCHQIGPGARMSSGPPLQGLMGRGAGTLPGYPFSSAMKASGLTWDEVTLDRFIAVPHTVVPGTRMIYTGMDDAAKRAALVAFIARQGQD